MTGRISFNYQQRKQAVKDVTELNTSGLKVYRFLQKNPGFDLTPYKYEDIASVITMNGDRDPEAAKKSGSIGLIFFAALT